MLDINKSLPTKMWAMGMVEKDNNYVKIISFFSFLLLILMTSCGIEESYKDFYVQKIDNYEVKEYFTSDELEFAQIDDIVIVPYIHATNHGEYTVDVIAYSQTEPEQIMVKSVCISDDKNTFYNQETEQEAVFRKSQDGIFEGWARSGVFYETDVDLSSNKNLYITVHVQVGDGIEKKAKQIDYEVTIVQYWSHVVPT